MASAGVSDMIAPAQEAMVAGATTATGSSSTMGLHKGGTVAFTLRKRGSYGAVQARVPPGAAFKAEARAMLSAPRSVGERARARALIEAFARRARCADACRPHPSAPVAQLADVDCSLDGGCFAGCARGCFLKESCCLAVFRHGEEVARGPSGAHPEGRDVLVAAAVPGDVLLLDVGGEEAPTGWHLGRGAFLASTEGVELGCTFLGCLRGCFGGEGCCVQTATASGGASETLVLSSFGGVVEYELAEGEARIVDASHLAAWSADMSWDIACPADCLTTVVTGQGLATRMVGPGRVYAHTHTTRALAKALLPYLGIVDFEQRAMAGFFY